MTHLPDELETKLRQDLGLLDWQIRDLLPIFAAQVAEAEKRGVAWTIGVIDELHMDMPTTDRDFKGIKNTLRDRYKAEAGVDPAPSYPVNVELTQLEGRPLPTEPQANYYICCACHSVQEDCCDSCIALHNPQPKAGA